MYVAAKGHIMILHTFMAPGARAYGLIAAPPLEPYGELQHVPLTCTPEMTSESFWNNIEFVTSLFYYPNLDDSDVAAYALGSGYHYTMYCAIVLALHDFLYVRGGSLEKLEDRDLPSFLDLVGSLGSVNFSSPSGPFHYINGTGDRDPIFDMVYQFAVDGYLNTSTVERGAFTHVGYDEDPIADFTVDLVWRDGSTGLDPNPDLDLFSDCALEFGVLVGERCMPCPRGYVFDTGSSFCVVCTDGTYQNESGRTACTISPPGFFVENPSLPESIAECPPGFSCPQSGTITPLGCVPGTYASNAGSSICATCNYGDYSTDSLATACDSCNDVILGSSTAQPAASSTTACKCPQDSYLGYDGNFCRQCPIGMRCPFGSDVRHIPGTWSSSSDVNSSADDDVPYPVALPGLMTLTKDPLSPYDCSGDIRRCPGGAPGTCGPNRVFDVLACGECNAHSFEVGTTCETCDGVAWLPLTLAALIAGAALVVTALVTNFTVQQKPGAAMTLSAVVGITVTSIQVLIVLDKLLVEWGPIVDSLISVAGVLSMQTHLLKVGCVTGNNPVFKYLCRTLVGPACVPAIAGILYAEKLLVPRSWSSHALSLKVAMINTIGTIASSLFISIVLLSVEPFTCYQHRGSGLWSMKAEPSVLCYSYDSEAYVKMVTISVTAFALVPLPFLACCLYFVIRYPYVVMSKDSGDFLHASRFLFYRFTPRRYYFNLIIILRNLTMGLVPAALSGRVGLEALCLAVILTVYLMVHEELRSWRTDTLNLVDALVCSLLLLVVLCGALLNVEHIEREAIEHVGGLFAISVFAVLGATLGFGLYAKFNPLRYDYFVCHHKAEAAAQARFLKVLMQQLRPWLRIFIDSDDLCDLDELFFTVRNSVRTLLVYLTTVTLRRPWCAGEITSACLSRVSMQAILTESFQRPSDMDAANVKAYLQDVDGCNLLEYGIDYADIAVAFDRLLSSQALFLPDDVPGSDRFMALARTVCNLSGVHGMFNALLLATPASPRDLSPTIDSHEAKPRGTMMTSCSTWKAHGSPFGVMISTLPDNNEAIAIGGILRAELSEKVFREFNCVVSLLADLDPELLVDEVQTMSTAFALVIVLTEGSLYSLPQINAMMTPSVDGSHFRSGEASGGLIPVNAPGFQFPGPSYFEQDLPQLWQHSIMQHHPCEACTALLRSFFRLISVYMPTGASQQVLSIQALTIMERFQGHDRMVRTMKSRAHRSSRGSSASAQSHHSVQSAKSDGGRSFKSSTGRSEASSVANNTPDYYDLVPEHKSEEEPSVKMDDRLSSTTAERRINLEEQWAAVACEDPSGMEWVFVDC